MKVMLMDFTQQKPSAHPEYAIYTYDRFDEKSFGVNKWQKYKTVASLKRAIQEARVLYRSNLFEKIKVKQRYIDSKLERTVSRTLKVFEPKSYKQKEAMFYVACCFIFIGAMAALIVLQ